MSDLQNGQANIELVAEPYLSFADLRDAHTSLLKLDHEMSDRDAFHDLVEQFCLRAHITGTLLGQHEDRRASQSLMNYWVATLFSADRAPAETFLADLDTSRIAKIRDEDCPYPGSRPFREADARDFFGRKTATEYISNRLKVDQLLTLIGPSGRGKTSLLLAGILPALRFEDKCANRKRFYFELTPGSDPLGSLEQMIKSAANGPTPPVQTSLNSFKRNSGHLLELIQKVTDLPVVILVDQLDDIFNLSPDRKTQRAFIANLLKVVEDPKKMHTVIITVRDDTFDDEMKNIPKEFRDKLEPSKWILPPLGAAEIGDAIKKPAERVGLKFHEPTLLSLIKEILAEPVGLPLLQFALRKLWSKRNDVNEVPDQALTDMGGCRAAFVNTADQLYNDLKPDQRLTARHILMRMVRVDSEGTPVAVPVLRANLYRGNQREDVDHILDQMSADGLVRSTLNPEPSDVQVELVHYSLARAWPQMSEWVGVRRTTQRFLKYAAVSVFLIGAVVLGVLGLKALGDWASAKRQLLSLKVVRQSEKLDGQHRYELAMLVGLHAYRISDNAASRGSILNVLHLSPRPFKFLTKPNYESGDLAFSPDNTKLATLDGKGNLSIWDLDKQPTVERALSPTNSAGFPLVFSADGKKVASAAAILSDKGIIGDPQSNIRLWDTSDGSIKNLFVDRYYHVNAMAFAPNGTMMFSVGGDGKVFRWDITKENPEPILVTILPGVSRAVAVNSTGTLLALGDGEGNTGLWSLESWQPLKVLGKTPKTKQAQPEVEENDAVWSLAFSPDGNLLAVDTIDRTVIWDVQTGQDIRSFSTEQDNAGMISAFDADGKTLTAYSADGRVFFLDIADGGSRQFHNPLNPSSSLSTFLALSSDGKLLAMPDENGITVWNLGDNRPLKIAEALPVVISLAFDPTVNSTLLAAGLEDGKVVLWDTANRQQLGILESSNLSAAIMLSFSPDGKTLVEGLLDGTILLWDVAERSQRSSIKVGNGGIFLDLAFSPDGKWLAAVLEQDEDNQLVLHNLETNVRQTVENVGTVTSVAISNDNRILYAGNTDGKVWAWDIRAQRVVAELCRITKEARDVCLPLEKSAIVSLRLDPQGKKLAAGTEKALSVWDVSDLSKLKVWFHKPRLEVSQLAFSRDGQTLTILLNKHEAGTWGRDRQGGLTLLDVNTGDQLGESIPNETTSMSFALRSDGKVLASSTNAHSIDLWDLNPGSAENFCAIANTNPSEEDWNIYTGGDQKYCRICPRLPSGEGAPADAPGCKYSGWRYWWDVITES